MSKLSFCLVLLIARTCTGELKIDAINHKRVDFLKILCFLLKIELKDLA